MDFKDLLDIAKLNEKTTKQDNSFKFSTKISNAKKLSKPGPNLTAIQKHLKKLDDEKRKKEEEYNKNKNNLLALRAQDKHSKKRVHSLINRTKGASKSVLDDAKDLTTAFEGEAQCDEDDYGYESTLSQQIFSKLQNVYSELPEDDRLKFKKTTTSSIEDIKSRVMSSLKKKQEEELGIRKRKRNRKSRTRDAEEDDGFINDGDSYKKFQSKTDAGSEEKERKSSKKKRSKYEIDPSLLPEKTDKYATFKYDKDKRKDEKREKEKTIEKEKMIEKDRDKEKKKKSTKSAPPPLRFEDLMKLASNKQKGPTPIIDPLQELLEKREKLKQLNDETRPLTAKEKKELEDDKLSKMRKVGKSSSSKDSSTQKESKKDLKSNEDKASKGTKDKVSKENNSLPEVPQKVADKSKYFAVPKPMPDKSKYFAVPPKSLSDNSTRNIPLSASKTPAKVKIEKELPVPVKSKLPAPELKKKPPRDMSSPRSKKPPRDMSPPRSKKPPRDMSPPRSKKPPRDMSPPRSYSKPSHSSLPPRKIVRPTQPKPKSFHRRIDSDEEYDSEMDDFIDDGDVDIDYSSEIRSIFKYDKSKYRDDDDDVDNMEASYSQMQKEEVHSARMGLMEDLEDIRREEEEKKRKKMLMKKRKL